MANNRLSSCAALAVLACVFALSASAEVSIPGYISSPSADSSAASAPAPTPAPTAPPDLSDSALDKDTTYTPAEIAEILKEHPNAFTAASSPDESDNIDAASSSAADQSAEESMQTVDASEISTIWDKPFNSYTPTEGYLLLLTVLALSLVTLKAAKYLWL